LVVEVLVVVIGAGVLVRHAKGIVIGELFHRVGYISRGKHQLPSPNPFPLQVEGAFSGRYLPLRHEVKFQNKINRKKEITNSHISPPDPDGDREGRPGGG